MRLFQCRMGAVKRILVVFLLAVFLVPVYGNTSREILHRKTGLTDAASNTVFNVACATGQMVSGQFEWTVTAGDAGDLQVRGGTAEYSVINDAGAVTSNITYSILSEALSAGTCTVAFAITAANPAVISVTPNSSLVPTTLTVDVAIKQRSTTNITLL